MYNDKCRDLNGEYIVVWNDNKQITMGPEQLYGTLFCPVNFYFCNTLDEALSFINANELVLPNTNLDG
jgi:DUF1365 family protein